VFSRRTGLAQHEVQHTLTIAHFYLLSEADIACLSALQQVLTTH